MFPILLLEDLLHKIKEEASWDLLKILLESQNTTLCGFYFIKCIYQIPNYLI